MSQPNNIMLFGTGERQLVVIPGLSMTKLRGIENTLQKLFRVFLTDYRVVFIDRRDTIAASCSCWTLAEDVYEDMQAVGAATADVIGVSQGGMIAQCLAIRHPEAVRRLVLGATLSRPNDTIRTTIGGWCTMVREGRYEEANADMFRHFFSDAYLQRYAAALATAARLMRPEDDERFLHLAQACMEHDIYDRLDEVRCPVLVLGGGHDGVVTTQASRDIAERLHAELHIYDDLRHGIYDEAPDFYPRAYEFFRREDL